MEFDIKPITSGYNCPDCMQDIMCSDTYRTLADGRRVHSGCGPAPIKFASIDSIPAKWSVTIGIDSIEWITFYWYRWGFDEDAGLMLSKTYEWNIRQFWKVSVEP